MAYNSSYTGPEVDEGVRKATQIPEIKGEVANYASLPGGSASGDVYLVIAATTGYPAGFYRYNGSVWVFMGREAAPVDSVNTQTGAVVLDADDIDDTSTTNKFTTAAEISKLALIEDEATADQTGAEIKTAYESQANTNAFTDSEKSLLATVSSGAEANTVDSVNTQTGAVVLDADDISDSTTTNKFTTALDISKLANIEENATADQTAEEIKTAYESNSDTNVFTDTEKTKLSGIAPGADVTDSTTVSAAGAPIISSGSGAPSSTPAKVGDIYIDTTSDDAYIAVGTASASDWEISNDGAGSGSTNLSWTASTSTVASSTGTDAILTNADATNAGLMSSEDKVKLDDIDPLAEVNAVDSVNSQTGVVVLDADDISDATTTNKFTTTASVDAAGATMNTDTDVSGNSWVVDEDNMASNDATKVPTQQSVKAYIDTAVDGNATSIQGTNVDASVGTPNDGDILVYRSAGSDFVLEAKPAAGSNPAAADITDATADGIALITSADANPFTDDDVSKLDGIEIGADVTNAASVEAAGALMDSEVDANIKTLSLPASTTISTFGASLVDDADAATARTTLGVEDGQLGITIDGAGSAITTGIKGDLRVPFDCTITAADIVLDQTGSIVIDVWKDTYANYPATDADSITASSPPTVTSAVKSTDSTLTGWTTSLSAGDYLRFNVDSITTATRATLTLTITK